MNKKNQMNIMAFKLSINKFDFWHVWRKKVNDYVLKILRSWLMKPSAFLGLVSIDGELKKFRSTERK